MKRQPSTTIYSCAISVPMHWVRANQLGILLSIIVTVVTQQYWVLAIPLAVQLISRQFGIKYNAFVRLFAPWLPASEHTEERVLLRFNNLLAILFMSGSLITFALGAAVIGYIFLGMLTIAVVMALSGFCLGCFMYFQWRQFLARRRMNQKA
ncbi:DUF4395 domain-containing protein [Paenibacillus abyssi]|uniref:DUF4395 domain-containing protein n=1 Tax=Paenibacillus abyssi TaxID=1340531 RepID=A0A917CZH5_9BACL|nr:DUF4395 domain-containing protein [Paenibacillus abyssi]GGG03523.1 hypothetical protein GCM10010916_20790 [Paenibacillus abyssi]